MKWTDHAWQKIEKDFENILNMPFIQKLKNGTLPLDVFQFYMAQDAKYLENYGRVLAYIGAKSQTNQQALDFFDFGKGALIVEKALHESYFEDFGLTVQNDIIMQPACHHYVHFLKSAVAFEPVEVAIAAVLPCFWIYKRVGDYIFENYSKENPYEKWIHTYSGDEFASSVSKAIDYTNQIAEHTTKAIREKMFTAFIDSTRLEYYFWEGAYLLKTW